MSRGGNSEPDEPNESSLLNFRDDLDEPYVSSSEVVDGKQPFDGRGDRFSPEECC